jgi:hypothetical protein
MNCKKPCKKKPCKKKPCKKKPCKKKPCKKKPVKKSQKGGDIENENYDGKIAQFRIHNDNVTSFKRLIKKDNDCVINALQLLNILDARSADIARIFVGDIGVNGKKIEQVFNLVQKSHIWAFKMATKSLREFSSFCNTVLKPQHAIFCGYRSQRNSRHVFIIARDLNKNLYYIDAQVNEICNLNKNEKCRNYLKNKKEYWVLRGKRKKITK